MFGGIPGKFRAFGVGCAYLTEAANSPRQPVMVH